MKKQEILELVSYTFQTLLVTYLVLILLEELKKGFVSAYFNSNYLLIIVIILGIVTVLFHKEDKRQYFEENKYSFFKKYSKQLLIGVLLIAFLIRIYYFIISKNQLLWWDEAAYLVQAKHIAFNLPNTGWDWFREPLMPIIFAFFYKIGLGEMFFRILMLIMSLLGIYLTYKIGEKMYIAQVAFIACLLMSIFYLDVFYTMRILLVIPSTLFALASLYFFQKGIEENKRNYFNMFIAALLAIGGMLIYYATIFIIFSYIVFLFLIKRFEIFKDKRILAFIIISIVLYLPYGIYSFSKYGTPLPRFSALASSSTESTYVPSAWANYITQFPVYLGILFFIIFLLYLIYIIFNLVIGYDLFFKQKNTSLNSDMFAFLWMLIPVVFLSFVAVISSGHVEDRYLHSLFPAIFFMIGNGLFMIYSYLKKFNKTLSILTIILILVVGMIPLIKSTNNNFRYSTNINYAKLTGLWIKENSVRGDVIISNLLPQNTYYSERATYYPTEQEKIKSYKPKFLVWYVYQNTSNRYINYVKFIQSQDKELKNIQTYFLDKEQKYPILMIYEVNSEIILDKNT